MSGGPSYGDSWNQRAAEKESCRWISCDALNAAIKHMSGVPIAVNNARNDALAYWNGLDFSPPFAEDRRFPRKGWINFSELDWPKKEEQMLGVLRFKELNQTREGKDRVEVGTRYQMKGRQNEENPTEEAKQRDEPMSAIPNDLLLAYGQALANMKMEVGSKDALYTVWKFEAENFLRWE